MGLIVESDCLSFSLEEMRLLFHQFPAVSEIHWPSQVVQLETMGGEVFTEMLPEGMMGGSADAPDEFVELWNHLALLEDEEALLWLSEAIHDNIAHINLQNGIKVPLQLWGTTSLGVYPSYCPKLWRWRASIDYRMVWGTTQMTGGC